MKDENTKTIPEQVEEKVCGGCGNTIDPDVCHCGTVLEDHGLIAIEHPFVPMGCYCGMAKEREEP